ncbi:uncharacterized protein PFL1_04332 [Pseudozyma flocculosa PF-1]|uniref:Uncharacterized protein n=1 Tax=Pseudozyma flocculosa PF-1 TaxID=1277687 RepID=A0A061H7P7_9BASI|nr:uncharacterized protein PFL1_04332 [Pseudozyma flocculosa PF-1]EPQ28005.1 hypothetical protein PFL1_04332 [Pseudozyma flocculosa PF-1]
MPGRPCAGSGSARWRQCCSVRPGRRRGSQGRDGLAFRPCAFMAMAGRAANVARSISSLGTKWQGRKGVQRCPWSRQAHDGVEESQPQQRLQVCGASKYDRCCVRSKGR